MKNLKKPLPARAFLKVIACLVLAQVACESKKRSNQGESPAVSTATATGADQTTTGADQTTATPQTSDQGTFDSTPGEPNKPDKPTSPEESPEEPTQLPTPPTGSASGATYSPWTPGPGPEGCYTKGQVWIAVSSSTVGKSGICGESLANYCCTQSTLLEKFPKYQSSLEGKFADYSGKGFTLYGCSTDGTRKTTLHFVNAPPMGNVSYATLWLEETSPAGTPPASCPRVTLENLGMKTADSTSVPNTTGSPAPAGTGTPGYDP